MRASLVLAVLAIGCKDAPKQPAGSGAARGTGSGSAIAPPVDWKACDAAVAKAMGAPLVARPQILLDGCRVCGDWTPILRWSTPHPEGGPTRTEIEAAMLACNAYCDGNAKQRFLGTLDKARGTDARTPWRQLAETCKDKVSATPDSRFMSAPYFALDRIGRAVGARGGDSAARLAELELPLPALSIAGTAVVLPDVDRGVLPRVGALQITVLGDAIHVGRMPRAKLGANGVTVEIGPDGYPGTKVSLADLGGALVKLIGDDKTHTVTLLAPHAMPARGLVPIIAAASTVAPLYLAANAHESPEGWQLAGAIPVALEAGGANAIAIRDEMTVQNLAGELVKRAGQKLNRIGVTAP